MAIVRSSKRTGSRRRGHHDDENDDDDEEGTLSGAEEEELEPSLSATTSSLIARYRQEAMGALRNAAATAGLPHRLAPLTPLPAHLPMSVAAGAAFATPPSVLGATPASVLPSSPPQSLASPLTYLPPTASAAEVNQHQQQSQSPQLATQPPQQQSAPLSLGQSASTPVLPLSYFVSPISAAPATSSVAEYLQSQPPQPHADRMRHKAIHRGHHRSPSSERRYAREMKRQEQLSAQLSQERERNDKLQADLRSLREGREASETRRAVGGGSSGGWSPSRQPPPISASTLLTSHLTPRTQSKLLQAQLYARSNNNNEVVLAREDDAQARSRKAALIAHSDTELNLLLHGGGAGHESPYHRPPQVHHRSGSASRARSRSAGRMKQSSNINDGLMTSPLVPPPPKVDPAHWARLSPQEQRNLFAEHMVHQSSYLQQQNLLQIHQLEQGQLARERRRQLQQQQQHDVAEADLWSLGGAHPHQRSMSHSASAGFLGHQQARKTLQSQSPQRQQQPRATSASKRPPSTLLSTAAVTQQSHPDRSRQPAMERAFSAAALPVYRPSTVLPTAGAVGGKLPLQPQAGGWM
jgi:hypothetical protein